MAHNLQPRHFDQDQWTPTASRLVGLSCAFALLLFGGCSLVFDVASTEDGGLGPLDDAELVEDCPDDWSIRGADESCYLLVDEVLSHEDSQTYCAEFSFEGRAAHLLTLESTTETEVFLPDLERLGGDIHIGLTRESPASMEWTWLTGISLTVGQLDWDPSDGDSCPDDADPTCLCAQFDDDPGPDGSPGTLVIISCTADNGFFCEWDR